MLCQFSRKCAQSCASCADTRIAATHSEGSPAHNFMVNWHSEAQHKTPRNNTISLEPTQFNLAPKLLTPLRFDTIETTKRHAKNGKKQSHSQKDSLVLLDHSTRGLTIHHNAHKQSYKSISISISCKSKSLLLSRKEETLSSAQATTTDNHS